MALRSPNTVLRYVSLSRGHKVEVVRLSIRRISNPTKMHII